jgi:hypothetical protein
VHVTSRSQYSLPFDPGLTARFRALEDVCQHVVITHRLGVDGVAAKLDMRPSELSRRLNAHLEAKEGDPSNRPLRIADLVGIVAVTGDLRPIQWLAEKFMSDPDAQRTAAMQQIAAMAPIFVALAEQAGLDMKARR